MPSQNDSDMASATWSGQEVLSRGDIDRFEKIIAELNFVRLEQYLEELRFKVPAASSRFTLTPF